jgi:hypothetical protein
MSSSRLFNRSEKQRPCKSRSIFSTEKIVEVQQNAVSCAFLAVLIKYTEIGRLDEEITWTLLFHVRHSQNFRSAETTTSQLFRVEPSIAGSINLVVLYTTTASSPNEPLAGMQVLDLGRVTGGNDHVWNLLFALDLSSWTKQIRFDASRIQRVLLSVESAGNYRVSAVSQSLVCSLTAQDQLHAFPVTNGTAFYPDVTFGSGLVPALTPIPRQTSTPRFTARLEYGTRRKLIISIHGFLFFDAYPLF